MSFKDMVNAAADAERRRRQKAREAQAEAFRQTEATQAELATHVNIRQAVQLPETIAVADTAQQQTVLPQASIFNSVASGKGQSTKSPKHVIDTPQKARHLIATLQNQSSRQIESFRTIRLSMNAEQKDEATKTADHASKALQEAEVNATVEQNSDTQSTAELAVRHGEQSETDPRIQESSQKPAALTALSLNSLVSRKRKTPSREASPEGLFVEPTPPPQLAKKARISLDPPEPKIKDEPEAVTDNPSITPVVRQSTNAEDVLKNIFGSLPKEAGVQQPTNMEDASKNVFGPLPKAPRTKRKPVYISKEVVDTRKSVSEWYENINTNEKLHRGDKATLDHVKQLIKNCIDASKNDGDTEKWFSELRTKIHEMEVYKFLSPVLVKKSKVLESQGLLQIFDGPDKDIFPWDVATDAEALWLRWMGGDLDGFLLRGITTTKSITESKIKRTSHKIENAYSRKRSANVTGPNNLMNGQWWPSRICALRDGAHGASEAGISGQVDNGAYSIVVSHGCYADEDHGETIQYCGTASKDSAPVPTPTADTLLLEKSYLNRQPIRVLRAAKKGSKYAPKEGIRYDGMYEIVDKEILDPKVAMSRFSLRRLAGQHPIRYQGVEIRPTNQELMERMHIRKDL